MSVDVLVKTAMESHCEWLEDVLAGLLSAGVPKDDIEVRYLPESRTQVAVRGEPRFEWVHHIATGGEPR